MKGLDKYYEQHKGETQIFSRVKCDCSQAVKEALDQKELVCSFCQKEIKGNAKNWGFLARGTELDVNYHGKCRDAYDKMVVQEALAKQREDIIRIIDDRVPGDTADYEREDYVSVVNEIQALLKDSTKEKTDGNN